MKSLPAVAIKERWGGFASSGGIADVFIFPDGIAFFTSL